MAQTVENPLPLSERIEAAKGHELGSTVSSSTGIDVYTDTELRAKR